MLVEEKVQIEGTEYWIGHTKEYMKVALQSENNLENQLLTITLNQDAKIIH